MGVAQPPIPQSGPNSDDSFLRTSNNLGLDCEKYDNEAIREFKSSSLIIITIMPNCFKTILE